MVPVLFLIIQQLEETQDLASELGPYKVGVATYILAGIAMIAGSLLKDKFVK